MVIQCTQCDTRFRIADEKLKPGGIKVRCSKCRHIFRVMPPEPEEAAPETTESEIDFGAFNMKPVPEEPSPDEGTAEPEQAEEKSEEAVFSSETAFGAGSTMRPSGETDVEEESPSQGPAEFDFGEESPAAQEPSGFDFEEEPPAAQEPSGFDFEEKSPAAQEPSEFDFEEESAAQGPSEFDFEEETTTEQSTLEFGFEDEGADDSMEFSFEETDPFADSGTEGAEGAETGAGAPEDFDFGDETGPTENDDFDLGRMSFGDEEPPAEPMGEDFGSIPMEQTSGIDEKPFAAAPQKKTGGSAVKVKKAAAPPAIPRRKSPFKGLLIFVLVLLLVLCGVAGYFFWQRGNIDIVKIVERLTGQGTPAAVTGRIRLSELSSSFIANRKAGQLFVIRGKATNDYPDTRSAIAVKGILYNKKGQPILQQTVFCGNHLDAEALRRMSFAKIEESMNNQFGDSLSNLNVGPGKSIPFTIVFKDLPPELAEYTVEAVDSKPGSQP